MLSEQPNLWTFRPTPVPADVPMIDHGDGRLEEITRTVATALGCDGVAVLRRRDTSYHLVAGEGPAMLDAIALDTAFVLAASDVLQGQLALGAQARFAAAARVAEGELVMLAWSGATRAELNAAEGYVLRAYAGQAAATVELAAAWESTRGPRRAEIERLRLLESVALHARDSIVITEAEPTSEPGPRILFCNRAFTETTGYSAAEVLGRTPRILQGPNTDPVARATLRAAFAAWRPVTVELQNYRKDGSPFWVELSIVPVADERGWYTHWVSVQRDVTERRDAEALSRRVIWRRSRRRNSPPRSASASGWRRSFATPPSTTA